MICALRLVFTGRLVEAGLTLVAEAETFVKEGIAQPRGVRDGLMIALLALCPIRLKNFAALEVGTTFREVRGNWWIALPSITTKSRRPDERRVPAALNRSIGLYLEQSWPVLLGLGAPTNALWISSTTGRAMTTKNLGLLILELTLNTLGVDVSPHSTARSAVLILNERPIPFRGASDNDMSPSKMTRNRGRRASSHRAYAPCSVTVTPITHVTGMIPLAWKRARILLRKRAHHPLMGDGEC
jgi:hypothetical protein